MNILGIHKVIKQYHNHRAVDEVSFDMPQGSIFGLLGPNGAGKTSLIRIITGITRADGGQVFFQDSPLENLHTELIGYLPEERGLYKKMKVGEQLVYLAQLKGLRKKQAVKELEYWLEKFEMTSWWNKKVEELSKGMQQKVQFVSTIVHKPQLIILDEPFTGLDPLNTRQLKDEIKNLNNDGASIIFSTHRMEQVEEICQDIVLINRGKNILQGKVSEIKERFKKHRYRFHFKASFDLSLLEGKDLIKVEDDYVEVGFTSITEANSFLKIALDQGILIQRFEELLPSLNDIFIQTVTEKHE